MAGKRISSEKQINMINNKIRDQIDQTDLLIDRVSDVILISGNSITTQIAITSLLEKRKTLQNELNKL